MAKDYEPIGTYSHPEAGTYSGNAATKWVFDESRQEGDTEIVENGTSIYLLVFHSRTRNDYNTVAWAFPASPNPPTPFAAC